MNKRFLKFEEARKHVRTLNLKSKREWKEYSKTIRPESIPSNPNSTYKDEWVSFQDWMGYQYTKGDENRKYNVNENFFKKWSHDMAYVLGFWFADGYLTGDSIKKKRYICGISQMERYILVEISEIMESTFPIHEEKKENGKTSYRVFLESKRLVEDLIKLGGKYRKSLDMRFPKIPSRFLPDFIRGLWDGDGSVFVSSSGRATASFTCGSKRFVDEFLLILRKHVIITPNVTRDKRRESAYYINLSPNDSRRLGKYLYPVRDCLCLERKRERFESFGPEVKSSKEIGKEFWEFKKAHEFVVSLGMGRQREWQKYCKDGNRPSYIPSNPYKTYKGNWEGWQFWLTGKRKK